MAPQKNPIPKHGHQRIQRKVQGQKIVRGGLLLEPTPSFGRTLQPHTSCSCRLCLSPSLNPNLNPYIGILCPKNLLAQLKILSGEISQPSACSFESSLKSHCHQAPGFVSLLTILLTTSIPKGWAEPQLWILWWSKWRRPCWGPTLCIGPFRPVKEKLKELIRSWWERASQDILLTSTCSQEQWTLCLPVVASHHPTHHPFKRMSLTSSFLTLATYVNKAEAPSLQMGQGKSL